MSVGCWPAGLWLALTTRVSHAPPHPATACRGALCDAASRGCPSLREAPFPLIFPAWLRLRDDCRTALAEWTTRRGETDADTAPLPFRPAVDALRAARLRPEIEIEPTRPPQRLAPYAYALEAAVVDGEEDLADGRLVLLHDPAGHDAWQGTFRLVTLVRAELEPEMAADPLLPEVCWSWLTGALQARGLSYGEAERHGHAREFALLRRARGAAGRLADRDPRLVDAPRGPRRGAGHRARTSRPGATCWPRSRGCRRPAPR